MEEKKHQKLTFAEKHPRLNVLLGLIIFLTLIVVAIWFIREIITFLSSGIEKTLAWFSEISSTVDVVVIVALISGTISIFGVVISSIVAKSLDYKRTRREYLTQKREKPYGEYIDMIYKIQQSSKPGKPYPTEEMVEDLLKFSKQITLWGSPRVVSNWVKFRELAMNNKENNNKGIENLLLTEQLMNDMRKDLGLPRVKKGNLLAFFINDIKDAMKQ